MRAYALIGMLNRYGGSGPRPWRWTIQQRQSWPGRRVHPGAWRPCLGSIWTDLRPGALL